jgi:PKHD-type hydroxylase
MGMGISVLAALPAVAAFTAFTALAAFPSFPAFGLPGAALGGVAGRGERLALLLPPLFAGFGLLAASHRAACQDQGAQEESDTVTLHGSRASEIGLDRARAHRETAVDWSRASVPFVTAPPATRAMQFLIEPLLRAERIEAMVRELRCQPEAWRPGAETAGWHARAVKSNQQLDHDSALQQHLASSVRDALQAHPLVQAAAFPRRIHGLVFSRCGVGQGYGRHVDNAWMAGGRSDLAFTLWLSEPEAYQGGALVLESPSGEESFRLPAGHALVYPSTRLHRVDPVSQGERLVAAGWIESRIRQADQRELLFELDTARRGLFARSGNDELFDLISRSYSNLLRLWEC